MSQSKKGLVWVVSVVRGAVACQCSVSQVWPFFSNDRFKRIVSETKGDCLYSQFS
jgi:hypothetical protein